MEKGWGLTLENSERVGIFNNKSFGLSSSPRFNRIKAGGAADTTNMFPVSLNRKEDGERRPSALNEVDFFSPKKQPAVDNTFAVKKELASHDEHTFRTDLNINTGLQLVTSSTRIDQSTIDDGVSPDMKDRRLGKDEVVGLQAELERMNAENQRLRGMLSQVRSNYSTLQMQLAALQQNSRTESTHDNEVVERKSEEKKYEKDGKQLLEATNSPSSSEEKTISAVSPKNNHVELTKHKEESPDLESWYPNKTPKSNSSSRPLVDEAASAMRKARVSVRARSESGMISDGCQWRKYGQKMAKGNPCPRAYYRCTMAAACPVRKQVQRCAEDQTILITTYEGTHSHPLPPAAMAMASTTSAAANMLLSGSMPSADMVMNPNFLARAMLPCSSSMATISASAPFPTITLDLTQNPNSLPNNYPRSPHNLSAFAVTPEMFGQGLYSSSQSKFSGLQVSQEAQRPQLHHPSFADTLSAAATAAITADPNFTAALAAAISSIINGSQPNVNSNNATGTAPNSNPTNINQTQ